MLQETARTKGKSRQHVVKHRRLYNQWCAMRRRCYDPGFISYPYYGGAGITVCDEWRTCYETFQTWALAHGWRPGLTLDRVDCRGSYEPANCRWLTRAEQSCNRLSWNIPVTIGGTTDIAGHWADRFHVPRSLVYHRILVLKWDPAKAVTTPPAGQRARAVTVDGETMTVYQWAKRLGVGRSWIYQQTKAGRNPAEVIRKIKEARDNGNEDTQDQPVGARRH